MNRAARILSLVAASMLCAATALATTTAQPTGGDADHGKTVYARCAACHDLNTGKTVLGPSMKGIVGRKAGAMPGFAYSPALQASAVVWTPASLDAYIAAPTRFVPGTNMAFAGLPDARDRADLIAFLQQAAR
ncbi:c-type cytochrome [Novosphingobium sp.]|uniref:c-type cytochrome n=1 Tax=Novosphingobium sp. TaxID=1874826 RepID=UPI00333E3B0D